ncbi:MAG TPA: helix-turn-helix domain-containing protein [Xanthobacteraceae bacterium]|nr:helix-turn-helix domain-containing protein [Xanthobacteraceae bacterium]
MLMRTTIEHVGSKASGGRATRAIPNLRSVASAIDMMGAPMNFARNSEIYGEGEPADYLYQVISGTVRTSKILADGRRQIGSFYLAGDIFGLEVDDEHTFSAEAIIDTRVRVIKRGALISLAARDSEVARQLWTLTGRELARVQDHILLLVKTAQERVVGFLLEMAARAPAGDTIELPMPRQDIADYLGLTIETVSRTLTMLENEGAIALPTSRRVMLRKRAALGRLNA